jgi:hypothetical protein
MRNIYLICLLLSWATFTNAQETREELRQEKERLDSLYIEEVENIKNLPDKVLHAEPLYIDLIRDLGARKGEKEWNVGFGIADNLNYDSYDALVEYEWAPANRLGLEVELPFTLNYRNTKRDSSVNIPGSKLNGIKTAAQWSFFVSEKMKTSMALGYLNELELVPFNEYGNTNLLKGNVYNPFLVAAKRWGNNFHTLVYTGPIIEQTFKGNTWHVEYQINTNFHYMISGTRNFIGVEINKEFKPGDFDMTLRPQMRISITENTLIGIVAGIPIQRENQRFSAFVRLIYEPPHKKKH